MLFPIIWFQLSKGIYNWSILLGNLYVLKCHKKSKWVQQEHQVINQKRYRPIQTKSIYKE